MTDTVCDLSAIINLHISNYRHTAFRCTLQTDVGCFCKMKARPNTSGKITTWFIDRLTLLQCSGPEPENLLCSYSKGRVWAVVELR